MQLASTSLPIPRDRPEWLNLFRENQFKLGPLDTFEQMRTAQAVATWSKILGIHVEVKAWPNGEVTVIVKNPMSGKNLDRLLRSLPILT